MATQATSTYDSTSTSTRTGAYATEHALAWVTVLAALVMGVIGLLLGFGVIGDDLVDAPAQVVGEGAPDLANWQEAVLWILPAIAIGLVSVALHNTDHHGGRATSSSTSTTTGLFNAEHGLAYLMAAITIAGAALGLLVGFDVFDNDNTFRDGFIWSLASVGTGVLTVTLHEVRHHGRVTDEDVIVRIIEERSMGTTTALPRTERVVDRPEERPL